MNRCQGGQDIRGDVFTSSYWGFILMSTFIGMLMQVLSGKSRDERGATAVEYGIMVALIAIVIIVAVTAVGTNLSALFTQVSSKV